MKKSLFFCELYCNFEIEKWIKNGLKRLMGKRVDGGDGFRWSFFLYYTPILKLEVIMIIQLDIHSEIEIDNLEELHKLKVYYGGKQFESEQRVK